MLDLKRLRFLRELDERGTIAAVADALQFTPSAVSQQLALLERETGVKLLERAGRGVRLTDPALVLVQHARTLLEEAGRAEAGLAAAVGAGPRPPARCWRRRGGRGPAWPRPSARSPAARASPACSRPPGPWRSRRWPRSRA